MRNKFYLYILGTNDKTKRFYVGQTNDLIGRVDAHNRGSVQSTKNKRPLELVYFISFDSRSEAIVEERRIKNYKDTDKFLCYTGLKMAPSSRG